MFHLWKLGCVALVAVVLLTGCGGGGGGGGDDGGPMMTNADLFGTYSVAALSSAQFGSEASSTWGQLTADGVGGYTAPFMTNEYGTVSAAPESGTYSVAADGAVTLGTTIAGGLAMDGSALLLSEVGAGEAPSMVIAVRRTGSAYSDSLLSGDYHYAFIWNRSDSTHGSAWTSLANGYRAFDGSGGVANVLLAVNNNGSQSTSASGSGAYSISSSGVLTVASPLGAEDEGAVTPNGSFAMSAGATTGSSDAMSLSVYIRTSTGATSGVFSGTYWVAGIWSDPSDSNNWTSFHGSVTVDGTGNLSYDTTTENAEGVISTQSGSDPYAVSPNGTLTSGDRIGAVTANGKYAFLSGENVVGGAATLIVFVKK